MKFTQDQIQKLAQDYAVAWSSGDPAQVAGFFTADGEITINRGDPIKGTRALIEMVEGFYKDFPDLEVRCDLMRMAGRHGLFAWTLEGHHAQTGNHVQVSGWEEWDLNDDRKVIRSLGWFDAQEYQRQIDGG